MNLPKVTLSFISYNRLHYLRATLESARECIRYPNLEWIVSDGSSKEPGLKEYIDALDWIDHKLTHQTHPGAMNAILEKATGEYLLIWPEDVQFVVRGDWMTDLVEIMSKNQWIGSAGLDHVRRQTIQAIFHPRLWPNRSRFMDECSRYGFGFRRSRLLMSSSGFKVRTLGWTQPGVVGSGIPSLTRTDLWRKLGPWRTGTGDSSNITDSSLGAEDFMVARFYESRWPLQQATPLVPVAADILTDPTGCKAKVRGRYRYGVYMPPPSGLFYYRIRDQKDTPIPRDNMPVSFAEGVEADGFRIPVDANGDRLKSSINMSVVYDIQVGCEIKYPLMAKSN